MNKIMTATIIILSILFGMALGAFIKSKIDKSNLSDKQEVISEEAENFNLNEYSFLETFEEFSIRKSTITRNSYIDFTLKVGGISVDRRIEAKNFHELMPKVKEWFDKNKEKLDFIDENLTNID